MNFAILMNRLFAPYLRKFVIILFDDILVYSSDPQSHLHHLSLTLTLLKDNNFYIKHTKCCFGQPRIDYLGHIVSEGGVEPDPQKIAAVQDWSIPTIVRQLRDFLDLVGYYRRFVHGHGYYSRTTN